MRYLLLISLVCVSGMVFNAAAIDYFVSGEHYTWQAHARLTLENGKTVDGTFLVSDPWLVVLPQNQDHSQPYFWSEITSLEKLSGTDALIRMTNGSSFKADFIYGIASGDRLYFYAQNDRPGTSQIYVLPLNRREKPTPEFVRIRRVDFLEIPQVLDPVLFRDYR